MGRQLLIWGAGGHAKVVSEIAHATGWEVYGYVDSDSRRVGELVKPGGAAILYDSAALFRILERKRRPFAAVSLAFGDNDARLQAAERLRGEIDLPALVHPSAVLSPSCSIGAGSVVMPRVVVNAQARVGVAAILNTGCIVEHDCLVGDGVHVSPHATLAGAVTVGACSWIGAGATVIQGITIGSSTTVGAGAVVIRDAGDNLTLVGSPARPV